MSASPPRQLAIVKQAEGNSNSSYCFTISLLGSTQLNLPSQYSLLLNKTFLPQHRQGALLYSETISQIYFIYKNIEKCIHMFQGAKSNTKSVCIYFHLMFIKALAVFYPCTKIFTKEWLSFSRENIMYFFYWPNVLAKLATVRLPLPS